MKATTATAFTETAADLAYRSRLWTFLENHHAELPGPPHTSAQSRRRAQSLLYHAGYIGITVPWRYGGRNGSQTQQAIVDDELANASLTHLVDHPGLTNCGPILLARGGEDHKLRYLPRLLSADDNWCVLGDQPAMDDDVTADRATAVCWDDGTWRLNGRVSWQVEGEGADYGLLLAETTPRGQTDRGRQLFIVAITSPGITLMSSTSGQGQTRRDVVLDDVAVNDRERVRDWTPLAHNASRRDGPYL